MLLCALVLLVLLSTIPEAILTVETDDVDRRVDLCLTRAKMFAETEDRYILKNETGPPLDGPQFPELKLRVYEKEKRQRPFECISAKFNGLSDQELQTSARYRALVYECKSKQQFPQCDSSHPYRTIDGTCNNLENPRWGSVLTCANRLFAANYRGISGFRESVCGGKPLPDPRSITLDLFTDREEKAPTYNTLFVMFSQILTHDITDFSSSFIKNKTIDCCSNPKGKDRHPQCEPMLLEPDDPFYSRYNISCFNFVRRALCDTCSVGNRSPVNEPTSYIDCSIVYGLTDEMARSLRANDGTGKLKSQQTKAGELPPPLEPDGRIDCGDVKKHEYCFMAGDRRANVHTALTILQILLLREHNRIAEELKKRNPHWEDEELYQVARKINIAQFQVITYNEILPMLIGPDLMSRHRLAVGSRTGYRPSVNPVVLVEFNAAVFRVHSIVPGRVIFYAGPDSSATCLRNMYQNNAPLYRGKMTSYLTQMTFVPAQKKGRHMTADTTNYLYKEINGSYGFDLAALDVQRGRDLGVPTYTEMFHHVRREEKQIRDFDDLYNYMDPSCINILKQLYCDVRDIDLWVGLNCELIAEDMVVGPTSAIIIALQFKRLKLGDRFYWEYEDNFTKKQRQTLKDASSAKLICDNTDAVSLLPRAMENPSIRNIPRPCSEIPSVNLDEWKDDTDNNLTK